MAYDHTRLIHGRHRSQLDLKWKSNSSSSSSDNVGIEWRKSFKKEGASHWFPSDFLLWEGLYWVLGKCPKRREVLRNEDRIWQCYMYLWEPVLVFAYECIIRRMVELVDYYIF